MKSLSFVVSLTTCDNDYQLEQALAAEAAAARLGVGLQVLFSNNNSIQQSQQLLKIIQSGSRPDGILFEPAGGSALPQVARAAVRAGIAWVVLNRDVDYLFELQQIARIPAFVVTSDHEEIGRIQGRQLGALLPKGGSVLCIQGPSESVAAKQRISGLYETKPSGVEVKFMKGHWTEASAHHAISTWLRLSTSRQSSIDLIAAHNDAMAAGARRAFEDLPSGEIRDRWLQLPYVGVDGIANTGLAWIKTGWLAATIVVPPLAGQALELLVKALQGTSLPPERTLLTPQSFPDASALCGPQDAARAFFAS